MMFDADSGATARQRKALAIGAVVVWLGCVSTLVYVVAHFIIKYW